MLDWLINFANTYLVDFGVKIILALLLLVIGLKVVKVIIKKIGKSKGFLKLDTNIAALILSGLKLVLNTLIIIIAVQIIGVPSATVIAALGSCGLAIGLALQGGLSNIAGGVMIMVFKPFHIGDFVSTSAGDGTVEDIGLFYTKLCTIDNRLINIPNSVLSSSTVTNLSAKPVRGLDIEVAVAYGSDLEAAKKALLELADSSELVLKDPAPMAFINEHRESSVVVTLRVSVKGSDYWAARFELMQNSLKAVTDAGVTIPLPQLDVHMRG